MSRVLNYPYWLGWPNQLFKPKRLRMDEMTDAETTASLTSRLEAAEKERDEARTKYQKLILSANGYGPALAQQDRRIEELESKCERLIFSCERTESERDEARQAAEVEANERRRSHAARDAATAEAERLKCAIRPFVALSDKRDAIYRKRGGDVDKFPDGHPAYDIMAKDIPLGIWRAARAALTPAPSKEGDGE
jgi:hypothetical protein